MFNRNLRGRRLTLESDPEGNPHKYKDDVAKLIYSFSPACFRILAGKPGGGESGKRTRDDTQETTRSKRSGECKSSGEKQPTSSEGGKGSQKRKGPLENESSNSDHKINKHAPTEERKQNVTPGRKGSHKRGTRDWSGSE